jgi:hypothetical protein
MIFRGVITEDGKYFLPDAKREWEAHKQSLAGYEVDVSVRKHRSKRSLKQNAWLHAFLGQLAEHWGYRVEELKIAGLSEVFGTHVVMGIVVPIKPHTSELNTIEMSDLCEWFIQKAAEDDVLVLYPEEYKRAQKKKRAA